MRVLSNRSLAEVMVACKENPRYKVIVFFTTMFDVRNTFDALIDEMRREGVADGVIARRSADACRIQFDTGSVIDFMPFHENNMQGRRCHDILWNIDISHDLDTMNALQNMSRRMLIQYHDEPIPNMIVDEFLTESTPDEGFAELDAFLDEFVISA